MKLILLLSMLGLSLAQVDKTLIPGSIGADVVEMVVNRIRAACIFPDDKLFLRRLAYVESMDGQEQQSYANGVNGGIWQVDQAKFATVMTSNRIEPAEIQGMLFWFGFDFTTVVWEDTKKPMFSGIAAVLYLLHEARVNGTADIARDVIGQAHFWNSFYQPTKNYTEFVYRVKTLETGCSSNRDPDMVFVIDGSGSVGHANFKLMIDFVKGVVSGFTLGADRTRVAVVVFSTAVHVHLQLDDFKTQKEMETKLDDIKNNGYPTGWTNTNLALDEMRTSLFTTAKGARDLADNHPRVGIIVTDGQSTDAPATVTAANACHQDRITMIAVGVGTGVDMNELEIIASEPTCQHLFLLETFTEFAALAAAIEQQTCDAPIVYNPDDDCQAGISITINGNSEFNCRIRVPGNGATLKLSSGQGAADIFLAETTFPNSAFFSDVVSTEANQAGMEARFLTGSGSERDVFCRFEADVTIEITVTICVQPGDEDHCDPNPCLNGGSCVDEGNDYYCECPEYYTGQHCETFFDWCSIAGDPCKNGGTCINEETDYVCECTWDRDGTECEEYQRFDCSGTSGYPNPCTQENRDMGRYHFNGPEDGKYVQCSDHTIPPSQYAQCWVMQCAPLDLIWNPAAQTCDWPANVN